MSQLLDKLDRAGDRFVQPLGFGGSSKREDVSPILVLGAIEADQTDETKIANIDGISPIICGRGWITGTHQLFCDPDDPWPEGYRLTDTWIKY